MKLKSPIVLLIAGVALAAGILAANVGASQSGGSATTVVTTSPAPASSVAPAPSP